MSFQSIDRVGVRMRIYQWEGTNGRPHQVLVPHVPEAEQVAAYDVLSTNFSFSDRPVYAPLALRFRYFPGHWMGERRAEDVRNVDLVGFNTPSLGRYIITLDASVRATVGCLLQRHGNLIPLEIDEEPRQFFLFHCTHRLADALNRAESLLSANKDGITDIKKYEFHPEAIPVPVIFRLPRTEGGPTTLPEVFVDGAAYEVLHACGQDGWAFKLIWDSNDPEYVDERFRTVVWERIRQVDRERRFGRSPQTSPEGTSKF